MSLEFVNIFSAHIAVILFDVHRSVLRNIFCIRSFRPKHVERFTRINNLRNRCILLVVLYEVILCFVDLLYYVCYVVLLKMFR